MANLIITVIAIALVAIASLMGAYYGGSAFLNNQSAANASTVLNEGQQLAGAWNAWLSDNLNQPVAAGQLTASLVTNGKYLAQIPSYPAGPGPTNSATLPVGTAVGVDGNTHYFAWADMGLGSGNGNGTSADPNASACDRIVKTAVGGTGIVGNGAMQTLAPGKISGTTGAGGSGNGTFGCAYTSAATDNTVGGAVIPAAHYVMEYELQ